MKTNDYISFPAKDVRNLTDDKMSAIFPGHEFNDDETTASLLKSRLTGFFKYFAVESEIDQSESPALVVSMACMYVEEEHTGYLLRIFPDNVKYHR
jgi:hypothetical protein